MENLQQYLKTTIAAKLSISDVCGTLDYDTEYSNHEDYWPDRSSHQEVFYSEGIRILFLMESVEKLL